MAIKILPPRLANQIAAGEVVERPASVVKELVENSLDAGATRIDIDIEKGGSQLIRIRDNGVGIEQADLGLALSRHATSKIHHLDDLEAIVSLGFRGEALASISSVSRLTLTSKIASQEEAWSAYAEGRDMDVTISPAAHPTGTTVEVADLFFNTPARRKFLRTEKTEFVHIDDLLKRIALSRFDVSMTLRHNGKMVRQYRAATTQTQIEKRVASVCGAQFMNQAVAVSLTHDDMTLSGWITTPQGAHKQNDLQYCYVNGRMMRDKLINHAIRQSYESTLPLDHYATYVLFITLDPKQVDVNVHPAKHEVRFHQARLVHDFIYQGVNGALQQVLDIQSPQPSQAAWRHELADIPARETTSSPAPKTIENSIDKPFIREPSPRHYQAPVNQNYNNVYDALFNLPDVPSTEKPSADLPPSGQLKADFQKADDEAPLKAILKESKTLAVIGAAYGLIQSQTKFYLIDINQAQRAKIEYQLQPELGESLISQPLLIPLALPCDAQILENWQDLTPALLHFGLQISPKGAKKIMVSGVPEPMRQHNLQDLMPKFISILSRERDLAILTKWLSEQLTKPSDYTQADVKQCLESWANSAPESMSLRETYWIAPLDFSSAISALQQTASQRATSHSHSSKH